MNQLHDRAQPDGACSPVTRIARGKQEQRWPQPFAAAAQQATRNIRDRDRRRAALQGKLLLDPDQIVPDEIEDFLCGQNGDGSLPCTPWGLLPEAATRPKKRRKFAAVAAATSSGAKFLTVASVLATSAT